MTYRTHHTQTLANVCHTTTVDLSTEIRRADTRIFDGLATIALRCGSATLQTYLNADACRSLARGLLAAAADLDRIAIECDAAVAA